MALPKLGNYKFYVYWCEFKNEEEKDNSETNMSYLIDSKIRCEDMLWWFQN
jgi:hypothetical protein